MRPRPLVFAAVGALAFASSAQAAWYNASWLYRTQLTLNGAMVPAAQTSFPVLVAWTANANLATGAQASGNDILFTAADGTTKLDHEIESYASATGALAAWVRVPALASGSNTTIYMYYGNAGAANQQNRNPVWTTAGFVGVWHLAESPANGVAGHADATGNGLTGTPQGFNDGTPGSTNAVGIVAGADRFLPDTFVAPGPPACGNCVNRVEVAENPALRPDGNFTVEAWVNLLSPAYDQHLVYKLSGGSYAYQLMVGLGAVAAFQRHDNLGNQPSANGSTTLLAGTWYHMVGVKSGGSIQVFLNGTLEGTAAAANNLYVGTPQELNIGATYWGSGGLNGREDEVRFSNVARSATWIRTGYNNLTNQGVGAGKFILSATSEALPVASVYYSVGTSVADLKAGTPTITIAAGAATFSVAQPNNVGVGDEITYNGATRAYISGRLSSTRYTVTTATGTIPLDVSGLTVNQIKRAFNLLSAAESGSPNATHLNTANLAGSGIQLNWPCYNDAVMDDSLDINGYTTGPTTYIRVYTPTTAGEVGVSQRHRGVFGTGFQLSGASNTVAIEVSVAYARVDGLAIQVNNAGGAGSGILSDFVGTSDVRISHNIIKGVGTGAGADTVGIEVGANSANVNRVWDNIVYNFHVAAVEQGLGIEITDGIAYVFSNTVYNCDVGIQKYSVVAGSQLRNDVSINDALNAAYTDYVNSGSAYAVRSNNVSSDTTSETVALRSKTAYATYFANTTPGTEDLHLRNTSATLWTSNGANLSADANLPVTDDIDGAARVRPDIGADEFQTPTNYRSIGTAANYTAGTIAVVNGSPIATGTGTTWLASNRGRGDRVYINGVNYVVLSVGSNTQLTLTAPYAGASASYSSPNYYIARQFTSAMTGLSDWENCVDGGAGTCAPFPDVTASLVADNRAEVGIVYKDSAFTPSTDLQIDGSVTDASHTITLTADPGNRHNGTAGAGVVVNEGSVAGVELVIQDKNVTIEWLELVGVRGASGSCSAGSNYCGAIRVLGLAADESPTNVLLQDLLIHSYNDGLTANTWNDLSAIVLSGDNVSPKGVTIRNTMIWDGDMYGIWGDNTGDTVLIENCSIDQIRNWGIETQGSTFVVRNTIVTSTVAGKVDFANTGGTAATLTGSNNTSSDATSATFFMNSQTAVTAASIFVAPNSNLHLKAGANTQVDTGLDLSSSFSDDIDGQPRTEGGWDRGADEATATTLHRSVGVTATALATGAANSLTISGSTATFAGALPNNVGVGDVIQYDSDGNGTIDAVAFVHGRTSSQSYTVKSATGGAPTAVAGDNDWSLFRAYTSLANWESQTANASINATVLPSVNPSLNLVAAGTSMSVACYADGADPSAAIINGWTTGPDTYINIFTPVLTSEVGISQRHQGVWDATKYRLVGSAAFSGRLVIQEEYVRVTGLQVENTALKGGGGSQRPQGILVDIAAATSDVRISQNILRSTGGGTGDNWAGAIVQNNGGGTLEAWNNIMYDWGAGVFSEYPVSNPSNVTLYDNTILNSTSGGIVLADHASGTYRLANNLVQGAATNFGGPGMSSLTYSSTNLSQDATSPQTALRNRTATFAGAADFHLSASDINAQNQGINLSADPVLAFNDDVDGQVRQAPWDIGADDAQSVTAVGLLSFSATGTDGAVDLAWATASEVDNLGFHVYRALSPGGPWTRLTSALIPGLGFSAMGASYAWRDPGLENGVPYFYRLEDVDTASVSTFHGPVSAVPQAGEPTAPPDDAPAPPEEDGSSGDDGSARDDGLSCPSWALAQLGSSASYTCETHGDPAATSFRVLSRTARSVLVELETGGFLTARDATGRVRALVPGFDSLSDPLAPALPLKRARLDGVVGRRARVSSIQARDELVLDGLVPAAVGYPQAVVAPDGTVNPGRREATLRLSRGASVQARLAGESFQGEDKSLALELMPLRYDASRGALVLSRRLTVRVDFAAAEPSETGRGRIGRRTPRTRPDSNASAFLATSQKGLHAVAFESVFPGSSAPRALTSLRLTRDSGRVLVPFFVLPRSAPFGPGSRLFFHVDRAASSTSFSPEVVYALERGTGGVSMSLLPAAPDGSPAVSSRALASFETNRTFAPDVLDIEDLWQWESLGSGVSKTKPFALEGLDASSAETARLVVSLQGGSDAVSVVDHHVQVFVNGALVADETFDGAVPHRVEAEVPVALLAATNELTVTNVGDTGVSSRVFLDRFDLVYPQLSAARAGAFDGAFSASGTSEVTGIVSLTALLDVTATPSWITGHEAGPSLRFRAQAGHRYLAVSQEALLTPRVFFPEPSARLRSTRNKADYILVAPRAFLDAAQPLLLRRQSQGLTTFAASLEEIASSFGGGQPSAEAIRDFLSFAYHHWRRPSPRYVLLLGDANHDPRHFNPVSQPSPMPFLLQRTSYIWTASDPALAAVNGDDLLPDLAIGRLTATTLEQAETMVRKVLDWEAQGHDLDGKVALVADNPDLAGDFEADLRDIEASFLSGRETTEIFLGQVADRDVARAQILDAFNSGLSLISYVGHGGGAVWAGENMLNSSDPASLLAQSRQPFMLTMNCLNGYFITPFYESLAEGFLKAEGRGTIAAFSPSGLSLDGPAHLYHRALMQEITAGQHPRLGDAVLAAQKTYAQTGAFPELLSLYHLFGDPAMKVR